MLKKLIGIISLPLIITSCTQPEAESVEVDVDADLEYCAAQVERSLHELSSDSTDYTMMPRNIASTDTV